MNNKRIIKDLEWLAADLKSDPITVGAHALREAKMTNVNNFLTRELEHLEPSKKPVHELAKDYDFTGGAQDYHGYIVDSMTNGQPQQVRDLYNQMYCEDQQAFFKYYVRGQLTTVEQNKIARILLS